MTSHSAVTPPAPLVTPDRDTVGAPRIVNESSLKPLQTTEECSGGVLIFPSCFQQEMLQTAQRLIAELDPVLQQQLLDEVAENHRLNSKKTIPLRLLRYLACAAREGRFVPELCFHVEARRKARQLAKVEEAKPASAPLTREQLDERRAELRKAVGITKPGEKS